MNTATITRATNYHGATTARHEYTVTDANGRSLGTYSTRQAAQDAAHQHNNPQPTPPGARTAAECAAAMRAHFAAKKA